MNDVGENNINKNYYIGKKDIKYILNEDLDYFYIDKLFTITNKNNSFYELNAVSLKITNITNITNIVNITNVTNITNNYLNLYNGNDKLNLNDIFNAQYKFIIYEKLIDNGYIISIEIETRTRINKNNISFITSVKNKANIALYISQKNCTMNNFSENFCQSCKNDYGKYKDKCYHKNEKFRYLYYNELTQTFEKCETDKNIFVCSICPVGTYIKDYNSTSYICEKCLENEYTNSENQNKCTLCSIPHCIECNSKDICLKCDNNALNGLNNCSICKNEYEWIFDGEICKCLKYFYKDDNNNIIYLDDECPKEMKYLNIDTRECKNNVNNIELLTGKYKMNVNAEELNKKSDDLIKELINNNLINEFLNQKNIELYGNETNIQIGIVNSTKINVSNFGIVDLGECPEILRLNLSINEPEKLLYKFIDFKNYGDSNTIKYNYYRSSDSNNPLNTSSICKNQTIKYITNMDIFLEYLKDFRDEEAIKQFIRDGEDIFNAYSQLYNDP